MNDTRNPPASSGAQRAATERGTRLRRIFINRDGLRPGWGALLFIAIFAGVAVGLSFVARHFVRRPADFHEVPPGIMLLMECIQLAAVILATAALAALERRPFTAFGLRGEARGIRFASGAACGFAALSALVLTLWQAGLLQLHASATDGGEIAKQAALWALVFVLTGLCEEMLLRGYLQYTLARRVGFWWATLLLSALFGAIHGWNPGETPVGLVVAMAIGAVFCVSLWYTGSLWWAIGFHAAWDWGESYFYGTSDSGELASGSLFTAHPVGNVLLSGGATGPEGSVLVFALLVVIVVAMRAWWGRRNVGSPFAKRAA